MKILSQTVIFSKHRIKFIILAIILITFGLFGKFNTFITQKGPVGPRSVIVSLIRSTNQSILLTMNMIHSVVKFHSINSTYLYPFLIFHDQNFTLSMREQILSCMLKSNKQIQISFALVDFETKVELDKGTPVDKTIGYRLMCRFWTYDVFYHPAIVQGQYDYLMRMDDDSYFSDITQKDLFVYMDSQKLDYIYRATYYEPTIPMEPILQRFLEGKSTHFKCIYNNFFVIRLKWFYESKRVQLFVRELIEDNLMLRQYIGDGCAHTAMLLIDGQVKVQHITDISYGHNFHIMPSGLSGWSFRATNGFREEIQNSCQQLTVLRGQQGALTRINMY